MPSGENRREADSGTGKVRSLNEDVRGGEVLERLTFSQSYEVLEACRPHLRLPGSWKLGYLYSHKVSGQWLYLEEINLQVLFILCPGRKSRLWQPSDGELSQG